MQSEAHLRIRLVPGALRPSGNENSVNEFRGGPETLLRWLEMQLGLPAPSVHIADRITEYATVLDNVQDAVFENSMTADRWATAAELLSRRDELMLSGWSEVDSNLLPEIVRDLSRATTHARLRFSGEATRLNHVLNALNAGQILPPHRCVLYEDVSVSASRLADRLVSTQCFSADKSIACRCGWLFAANRSGDCAGRNIVPADSRFIISKCSHPESILCRGVCRGNIGQRQPG